MKKFQAKITYLDHSGFAVELPNKLLVFDYFRDPALVLTEEVFATDREIYVFASHGHQDHFNPRIFSWQQFNKRLEYILSSDIAGDFKGAHKISKGDILRLGEISVQALGSTDLGVSFLVKAEGLNIFHAGDLNWWHWRDESTDEEVAETERAFLQELAPLLGEKIDIAFFPTDPRLGTDYAAGAELFIKLVNPRLLIPMHFGDNFVATKAFAESARTVDTEITSITRPGQSILY